jgi:sigma-B regulation protein RsbU (phosphoserine phosphatase)
MAPDIAQVCDMEAVDGGDNGPMLAACSKLGNMHGKILVVDDEELGRLTVQRFLRREGFEVDVAAGGIAAEDLLSSGNYDVAVIDLRMPDVDGFQVLEWLRENCPRVVPVVLSGTSSIEDALRAVQQGAYDFVSKPVESIDVFITHMRRAVEHRRLRDANEGLLEALKEKNIELENRFGQLELAHSILQSQAVAIQIDLNRAMRLQQGLLPKSLPFSDTISLAAIYHPMAKVGGDLYDIFQLDDHRLGLYIADTSGHGISSAMLTIFLKHAVLGILRGQGGEVRAPGESLCALNQVLVNEAFGQGIFVSMTYLVLDMTTMAFRYSSAGHPPIFVKGADGSVRRLHKPAPVLGLNPRVLYTDEEVQLHASDLLTLYTDGIVDARDTAGECFGEERLKAILAASENHADAVASGIEKTITAFCEGRQHTDDFTLVVLGVEPQRVSFHVPDEEPLRTSGGPGKAGVRVLSARHEGQTFISISGMGSWRESQQILELCRDARRYGDRSVVLDMAHCSHLDSTFLGVLHNIASSFDSDNACRLELQNLPRVLLQEISNLGLAGVLMHFRPKPLPLPDTMQAVEGGIPAGEEMGRLLLWAHEALVDADPSNADRFAAVLQVLHDQAKAASAERGEARVIGDDDDGRVAQGMTRKGDQSDD